MHIHSFYPSDECDVESPFVSRYILNKNNTESKGFLWCLIAYLHPAKDIHNRVSNYSKPKFISEIKLPSSLENFNEQRSFLGEKIEAPDDYYYIKKIQDLKRGKKYLKCSI